MTGRSYCRRFMKFLTAHSNGELSWTVRRMFFLSNISPSWHLNPWGLHVRFVVLLPTILSEIGIVQPVVTHCSKLLTLVVKICYLDFKFYDFSRVFHYAYLILRQLIWRNKKMGEGGRCSEIKRGKNLCSSSGNKDWLRKAYTGVLKQSAAIDRSVARV